MTVVTYIFAAIGALLVTGLLYRLVAEKTASTYRRFRKTEFGQAVKPMKGVIPIDRLCDVMKRRNEREDVEHTYHPRWACIGTAKLSVGVLYISKRAKPKPFERLTHGGS